MNGSQARQVERRYERKMCVAGVQREWAHMLTWEHPAHFTEVHPFRYVNNLYLDTFRHSYYADHVAGVSTRKKVRVRWYGPLDGDLDRPQLEIKSKEGWMITKQVYPLQASRLDQLLVPGGLRKFVRPLEGRSRTKNGFPPSVSELIATLQPTLINRYHRRYFQTRDGRVRVTVDTEMSFYHADRLGRSDRPATSSTWGGWTDRAVIVEIKFAEHAVEHGNAVAAHFPLPLTKNSKYITGIELLRMSAGDSLRTISVREPAGARIPSRTRVRGNPFPQPAGAHGT